MIKRKDGRWQEQVKLPGMSKPKYFYGKTQKEVHRKMAEWSQEKEEEKAKAVLFETVADEWLTFKVEVDKVGWATEHCYKPSLREAKDWFSGRNIGDIYADEVMEFLKSIAAKGLGFSAVSKRKNVMNGIFDYAILKRMIKYNPARSAKMPGNLPKGTREPPEDEQVEQIKTAFGNEFGLFPLIQAFTGMRRAELLALRWEDFDWERNVIKVTQSIEFISSVPHVKKPKTDAGIREISLLEPLKQQLPHDKHGIVFPGNNREYMGANEYDSAWKRWCISAGLAVEKEQTKGRKRKLSGLDKWRVTVTSHQLRHYYATILYEAGIRAKDAQNLLGHADIQTTLNVYTHIRKKQKKAATDRLNQFLCQEVVESEKSIDK